MTDLCPQPVRTRTMAAVFAGSLGGVGAHKFYLNRPAWGVVYALFCWTLIPTIVSLFEMIAYLRMSDDEFEQRYSCHSSIPAAFRG
jgi:TM2 domain-containing membrane protein YozV